MLPLLVDAQLALVLERRDRSTSSQEKRDRTSLQIQRVHGAVESFHESLRDEWGLYGEREGRGRRGGREGGRERLERAAQPRSAPRSPSIVAAALLDDVDRDVVALDAVDGLLGVVHAKLVLGENEDCRAARTVSSRLFAL